MVLLLGAFQCGLRTGPTSPGLSPPPARPILNLHWLGGLACPTLYLPGNALHPTHKLPMAGPFPGSQSHPLLGNLGQEAALSSHDPYAA